MKALLRHADADNYVQQKKISDSIAREEKAIQRDLKSGKITQQQANDALQLVNQMKQYQAGKTQAPPRVVPATPAANPATGRVLNWREQLANWQTPLDEFTVSGKGLADGMLDPNKFIDFYEKTANKPADPKLQTKIQQLVDKFNNEPDFIKRKAHLADLREAVDSRGTAAKTLEKVTSLRSRSMLSELEGRTGDVTGTIGNYVSEMLYDTFTGDFPNLMTRSKEFGAQWPQIWQEFKQGTLKESGAFKPEGQGRTKMRGGLGLPFLIQDALNGVADRLSKETIRKEVIDAELQKRGLPTTEQDPNVQIPEDVFKIAEKVAKEKNWGGDSAFIEGFDYNGKKVGGLQQLRGYLGPAEPWVMPFAEMTMKVMGKGADFAGYGLGKQTIKAAANKFFGYGEGTTGRKVFKEALKTAAGYGALMTAGYTAYSTGNAAGSYLREDPEMQAIRDQLEIPQNSINVGGHWVPVRYLGPAGMMIQAGIELAQQDEQNTKRDKPMDFKTASQTASKVVKNVLVESNPALRMFVKESGSDDLFSNVVNYGAQQLGTLAQWGINRTGQKWTGAGRKELRSGDPVEEAVNKAVGLYAAPEKTGITGGKIGNPSVLRPSQLPEEEKQFLQELYEIKRHTKVTGFVPTSKPEVSIEGEDQKRSLSSADLTDYQAQRNILAYQYYPVAMNNPAFQNLSYDQKAKVLKSINDSITYVVQAKKFNEDPGKIDGLGYSIMSGNTSAIEGIIRGKIASAAADELKEAAQTKKREAIGNVLDKYR